MFDAEALASNILDDAISRGAEHVWLEPKRDHLRVRVRVSENANYRDNDSPQGTRITACFPIQEACRTKLIYTHSCAAWVSCIYFAPE